MRNLIINSLQKALNRFLALDPESKNRLQTLAGKIITIELLNLGITFQLLFIEEEINLQLNSTITPDTIIKGTPFSLFHLALADRNDRKKFFAEDVVIEGDIELGQKVIELFDALDIDWEEYLSQWLGDIPAFQIGRVTRRVKKFNQQFNESLKQNINEYIHEEKNWFPPREELNDFFHDIDNLRMDVDRLTARVNQLIQCVARKRD